jgi:tripartite-type tricarboxylate transporter receptor subunit TctC
MLVAAPARTPAPIVERVAQSIAQALRQQEVRSRMESLGVTPESSTPERAAELLRRAQEAYVPVVRQLESAGSR